MLRTLREDPLSRMLGHTTVVLVLLTSAYYLYPLRFDRTIDESWGRLVASFVATGVVVAIIARSLARTARERTIPYSRLQLLLSALYILVLLFAALYAQIESLMPGQFVGIEDSTDALYFSVTVMATVGFGDVHPEGTTAKLVVTSHMLFNLIYLGTALRVLTARREQQAE